MGDQQRSSVLDLIDSALADCTSDDAMRWAPDVPADTSGFLAGSRIQLAADTWYEVELRSSTHAPGLVLGEWQIELLRCLESPLEIHGNLYIDRRTGTTIYPAPCPHECYGRVWFDETLAARNAQSARLRRMHSEYSRRTRRRNRRG